MNIALIGYGKMGQAIEVIAVRRGHKVALKADLDNARSLSAACLQNADVAIEFTDPAAAAGNLKLCFEAQIPVVCGTTGWLRQWDEVAEHCRERNGGLFYASNYSIGVNVFFAVNRRLAKLMNPHFANYTAALEEIHHTEKKDAPSGTAITLAEGITGEIDALDKWTATPSGKSGELPIKSVRQGDAAGTHIVAYESDADILTICHQAKNRTGFALGAVMAAEFMQGKTGIYGMGDLLGLD